MAIDDLGASSTNIKNKAKSRAENQITNWKKRLIDFSRRNQLLYYKPRTNLSVEISDPAVDIFKTLILDEETVLLKPSIEVVDTASFGDDDPMSLDDLPPGEDFDSMSPVDDLMATAEFPTDTPFLQTSRDDKGLTNALNTLRTRSKASLNEHGINILYLGMYFIKWYDVVHKETASSPLIMIPVSLSKKGINAPCEMSVIDDEMTINPTLAYKLQHEYGIKLPDLQDIELEAVEDLEKLKTKIETIIKAQSNWELVDETTVSLFSFAKLSMYKDLEENKAKILNHPVIRSFSGEQVDNSEIDKNVFKAKELDDKVNANQSFQILDADSSQQEAVYAAKAGQSFVLQGPPGTGKSQTISNIIAESLAQNKKILFVSEKKAALEVVTNRLKASGLDKYCLELHGSRRKKSDVISNLKISVDEIKELAVNTQRYPFIDNINEVKQEMHAGIAELHKLRHPINKSLYEIYGELAELSDVEDNNFNISSIERLTEKELSDLDYLFTQIEKKEEILNDFPNYIWKNASPSKLSFELENEIKGNFLEFQNVLTKLQSFANPIAKDYFNREVTNMRQFKWLSDACKLAIESPFPKQEWFAGNKLDQVKNLAVQAQNEHGQVETKKDTLLAKYSESFMMLNHNELLTKFTTEYVGVFKFLNIGYWKTMAQVKKTTLYNDIDNLSSLVNDLEQAVKLTEKKEELEGHQSEYSLALGDFYKKYDTDWQETLTAIQWVQKILNKVGHSQMSTELLQVVSDSADNDDFEQFKSKAEQLILASDLVKFHLEFYRSIFPQDNIDIENLSFEELNNKLQDFIDNISKIEDWIEFKKLRSEIDKAGLKQFIDSLLHNPSENNAGDLKRKFRKKFYQLWIDKIELESSCMRSFSGEQQQLLIDRFNDLDLKQLSKVNIELAKRLALNWIEFASSSVHQDSMQILNAELNKKRRHKPIRMLVKEIPDLLQTLKPCWMMSPLTVSQLIDQNSIDFDIVIFDEASQIRTEDAIPSIYRGKQLVLAGDTHQLPPTNFFNLSLDDDEEYDEDAVQFDSVLDEAAVFLENRTLNWHYRSRHESLITFSNRYIYENSLITFPSPVSTDAKYGVHFELVENGYYERGSRFNRNESKHVAQAIIDHYQANPDQSLGVIAFSEAQQGAIERELEKLLRKNEGLEKHFMEDQVDACFIKNLENVQGDERDVIFFSIGYARDKKGVLSHNFGPLNKDGGHRRLNVAVTRARNKLKVFSSITAGDIDLSRTSAKGASLLKQYLAYTQAGGNIGIDDSYVVEDMCSQQTLTSIEDNIAKAIEEHGYKVQKYLGTSSYRIDLAVYTEEEDTEIRKYLLAIETDGYMYQSASTARDRERLRKQVLESLGWKVHRIYARDWIKDPQAELDNILFHVKRNAR